MAQQQINTGTAANDGTGDTLREAFTKTNANFTELYEGQVNVLATLPSGEINIAAAANVVTFEVGSDSEVESMSPRYIVTDELAPGTPLTLAINDSGDGREIDAVISVGTNGTVSLVLPAGTFVDRGAFTLVGTTLSIAAVANEIIGLSFKKRADSWLLVPRKFTTV